MAGALAGSACSSSTGTGQASLTVKMHDASGSVKSAWVSVAKVYATGPNGRVDLTGSSSGMIQLTTLTGGDQTTLASATDVDPGSYSDVYVVLGDAAVEMQDGTVYGTSAGLTLPGTSASVSATLACSACGGNTGVKVHLAGGSFDASSGSNTLLVDFDLARSVQGTASGSVSLQPVLVGSDESTDTGKIAGGISLTAASDSATGAFPLQCGGQSITKTDFYTKFFIPQATAQNETDLDGAAYVKSGAGTSDGTYAIQDLPEDGYTLGAVSTFSFSNGDRLSVNSTPSPSQVKVSSNQTADADFTATVSCTSG